MTNPKNEHTNIAKTTHSDEPMSTPESMLADTPTAESLPAFNTDDIQIDNYDLYLNRELTWLEFNRRVLHESIDENNPLLERLKFLAIFSSNIDEFFMKRIGGLNLQVAANVTELTVDGRTPKQQLEECREVVRKIEDERDQLLMHLLSQLQQHDICIINYSDLTHQQQSDVHKYYLDNIFPLITPQVFDPAHPFPFISNLSLNILVTLPGDHETQETLARIKVPIGTGVKRFIPIGDSYHFVPLEQVIANNLDLLFPGVDNLEFNFFSVTRNASAEKEESGANDLMELIESELRDRRIAPIVRIVINEGMSANKLKFLTNQLGLSEDTDVFICPTLLSQRDLFQIANLPIHHLRDPSFIPVSHYRLNDSQRSIFYILRESESLLLQHPYESFATSVVRFLEEASRDRLVRAIKMTLYRTDEETRIVDLLIKAAQNGKQVAVVVELKAKFDEAANINWASRMEEAGIHVTYGVIGLKTHCKCIMVVRQDYSGLNRYVHIGTGNYHGGTAKLYSDLGLLTCNPEIGHDVTELFNYLTTGYAQKRQFKRLLPAPKILKKALLKRIQREIDLHSSASPGLIQMKTNALEDRDIVFALYQASIAGVKVELIVRDTCRLRPGIKGLSDNITVISIVGRFLEHSRIFYFKNGGDEEYFIGSADLMKRNLESRVEIVAPILKKSLKRELRLLFNTMLDDDCDAWEMQSDGSYIKRQPQYEENISSQLKQIIFAQTRQKSKKHKKLLKDNNLHREFESE